MALIIKGRSKLKGSTVIGKRPYAIDGVYNPELVLDFPKEYYRTNSVSKTFANAITHSAASNATMVDSDGVLKWRPHNLALRSEELNTSPWFTTAASISANTTTSPDNTVTADEIVEDTSANIHRAGEPLPSFSGRTTFKVFAKLGTGSRFLTIGVNKNGSDWASATFNLSTGVNTQTLSAGTYTNVSASIVPASNGFYLCSITATIDGFDSVLVGLAQNGTHTNGSRGFEIYTGDGTSSVVVWGAHLYRSDLGGMVNNPDRGDSYVPTTSSAVYLPRRGHHVYNGSAWVNEGLLHESEARTNLLTYSEDFSQWTINSASFSSVTNTAPDGSNTSYVLISNASTVQHQSTFNVTFSANTTYTFSIYVKDFGAGSVGFGLGGSGLYNTVTFTFSTEAFSSPSIAAGYVDTSYKAENVGNGWYRISLTTTTPVGSAPTQVRLSDTDFDTVAGDGTSGVYFFGAQLELGPTPSSYIPTSGATATRAAETLTIPAANLPWPTPEVIGPEIATGTPDTLGSDWTDNGDGSYTSNGALTSGIDIRWNDASISAGKVFRVLVTISDRTQGALGVKLGGGATTTFTQNGTFEIILADGSVPNVQFIELANLGLGFDGTISNISVREINPLAVSIQMDGRVTYADEGNYNTRVFWQWTKDSDNFLQFRIDTAGSLSGQVMAISEFNNSQDFGNMGDIFTPDINIPFDIASRHTSLVLRAAESGILSGLDTHNRGIADFSTSNLNLGQDYMGTIRTFRVWADDITDAGLEEATEPSLVPSLRLTFDGTENSFIVEDWSE